MTTLSWRGRIAWSLLPLVPLMIFIWGGLGLFNPMLWVVAAITAIATARWLPHVWTRTVIRREHPAPTNVSANAAHAGAVDPADHFAWITPSLHPLNPSLLAQIHSRHRLGDRPAPTLIE
jgi:hypothetical protein